MASKVTEVVTDGSSVPQGTSRFFTKEEVDELLNQARSQERDKLYPTIEKTNEKATKFEEELKELQKFRRQAEKEREEREKLVEAERKKAEEAKLTAEQLIAKREEEMSLRFQKFQQEQELKVAMIEKQSQALQLQSYILRRLSEEEDNIEPELRDFVGGDTEAEVEASIEVVKAKSARIAENVKMATSRQRSLMPGVAPSAGINAQGLMDTPGDRQLTADDIKGMSMAEFDQLRKRIGMPNGSGRGLFD
jgi:hypothetical protein